MNNKKVFIVEYWPNDYQSVSFIVVADDTTDAIYTVEAEVGTDIRNLDMCIKEIDTTCESKCITHFIE